MKSILQVYVVDVISKAILAITGMLIIRYLPYEEYARYTLALSLITIATQTLASSFNRIYIVGHDQLLGDHSPFVFLGLQLWIVVSGALLLLPWSRGLNQVYWWIVVSILANCFSEFAKTSCQLKLHFGRFSAIELSRSLLMMASLLALTSMLRDHLLAWQVLVAQAAAMLTVFVVAFGGRLQIREMFRVATASRLAIEIVRGEYRYLFGFFFLQTFLLHADVFMLNALSSRAQVATYGSAFRYCVLLSLALNAVHTVLFPMLQRMHSGSEIERVFKRHRMLVVAFAPVAMVSIWAARWALPWIDLGKYPQAVPTFQILAASAIVSFAFSPYANLLMRFKDFKFLLWLLLASLALNVALSLALLPSLGAIGAAIAFVLPVGMLNTLIFVRARGCLPAWLALVGEGA